MKKYEGRNWKLYNGNMLDMMDVIVPCSIDSIVTDPPYELNFMGKGWDNSGIAFRKETWEKCYEVLKPGGYLLAFGGSRTFHRIAVAIEDAGFEIRDTIMWLYGSGFPKSLNIGKSVESKLVNGSANTQAFKDLKGTKEVSGTWGVNKWSADHGHRPKDYTKDGHERTVDVDFQTEQGKKWDGWGTALKPSYEPIIVARKPCEGSCTDNVIKYGVGGINIDGCRVGNETLVNKGMSSLGVMHDDNWVSDKAISSEVVGRFPANTILTYDETDFDEVCGGFPMKTTPNGSITNPNLKNSLGNNGIYGKYSEMQPMWESYGDSGSAARYFYCAKASKRDRDEGLDNFELQKGIRVNAPRESEEVKTKPRKNTHPTVKPTSLMQYLVRLVTPKGGTVLDPFNGSGSTGKAVMYENKDRAANYKYIGIELTEDYIPIAAARIGYVAGEEDPDKEETVEETRQLTIFDYIAG